MKAKFILLLFFAGFLAIFACTNPFIEKVLQIETETPTPVITPPVTYTVAFDSKGGSPVPSQTVTKGGTATRPNNPNRDGYGFVNWYDKEELAEPHYNFDTPITGNITLYAKWSQTFYTVIFMDGETELYSQIVGEGGTASPLENPTKDGYVFDNWYGDPDLTALYDFDTPVTAGISLYAGWIPVYTVTFMDGGTVLSAFTKTVTQGGTVDRPETDLAKAYHTFYNWYADGGLTAPFDFSSPIIENTTVYAGWSDADFAGDVIDYTFNVANEDEWDAAVNTISGGGNDKNYVINVTDDFSAGGSSAATFGGASDVTVSLRGTGRTLSLSSTGSILRADGGQNIILRDLTLRGYGMNYNSLVYVNSGTFAMYGGAISGNKMSNNSGAGVYVGAEGTFIMYGGEISDNTASRGYGGGGNGGGVCTSGTFRIINGTIYGKDEDWNVKNTAGGAGAALYCSGTVEYGTFIEGEWSSNGSLTALSYDDTIRVINGVLQPYFISVSTNGSPALSTTALTLTFSQAIPGLSAGDITLSGAYSVTKGQLGEPGSDGTRTIYLLPVSGFTEDGTLSVSVSKEGYTVGGPRTASIYYVPLIEMKLIPAGTFTMGSPASELNRAFEETQHQVTLTKGFYMGKYQVTQAQYQAVMGSNPSDYIAEEFFVREDGITDTTNFPVEKVNWYDAIVFCNKLSILEGLTPAYRISGSTDPVVWGDVPEYNNATWNAVQIVEGSNGYRLPTEAQWEYACRAGTTTAFNWGTNTINSTQANYNAGYVDATNPVMGTYLRRTTDVGSSAPNAWGLYDMHGNVWEMCWDWADSSYYSSSPANDPTGPISGNNRISRGGSWYSESFYLRSANRSGSSPFRRGNSSGFRVVRPSD